MADALLVLFPGCVHAEVAPAITLLAPHVALHVASPDGSPVRVAEGIVVHADLRYADASARAFGVVVVPGGSLDAVLDDAALRDLLVGQVARTAVGAICNGALLLSMVGAVDGRRVTHTAVPRHAPRPAFDELLAFAEPIVRRTVYVDEDVVVDGSLVTAKPWAAIAFAEEVAKLAGVSVDEARRAARYLHGDRGPG